jgi:phospholipase C
MSLLDDQIEHLVVLMMENRSFDHLLGYLSKEEGRSDIHGLTGQESNVNPLTGQSVFVHPFPPGATAFRPDPLHGYSDVAQQLGGHTSPATMEGFIRNFALATQGQASDPGSIMGYYQKAHLPVYDFFANHYCICDHWHSSVPGETWPNRLFALAGTSANWVNNPPLAYWLSHPFTMPTIFDVLTRYSPQTTWEYYAHDVAFLRVFQQYQRDVQHIHKIGRFYTLAEEGRLPQLSWIDPRFTIEVTGATAIEGNDDHPPTDLVYGQALVGKIYNALVTSSRKYGATDFAKILLIVVYDEHGGFYDHVSPPAAPPPFADESGLFDRYGVRVPAFLISPWLQPKSVSHMLFDHTSVLKTILEKFCRDPQGQIPHLSTRVANANSLSQVFDASQTASVRTDAPLAPVVTPAAGIRRLAAGEAAPLPSAFQQLMQGVKEHCLSQGVPPEQL